MIKNYLTPKTLKEAVELKEQYGINAKYLGGGTELNLEVNKLNYETFIDLKNLKLNKIKVTSEGNVEIGSMVTFQSLVTNEEVPVQLKQAANYMESRNIRNIATIGGNIGGGKTVGDLLPTLFVLNAKLKLGNSNSLITVEKYVEESNSELIEKIIIEKKELEKKYNSKVYMRSSNDLSILGTAISYIEKDKKITDIKIAIGGVSKKVIRLKNVEKELENMLLTKEMIVELIAKNITPISDIRGSKEFKTHLVGELVADCFKIR